MMERFEKMWQLIETLFIYRRQANSLTLIKAHYPVSVHLMSLFINPPSMREKLERLQKDIVGGRTNS